VEIGPDSCKESRGAGGLGRIRITSAAATCRLNGAFNPALASGCTTTPGAGTAGRAYIASFPD
jgi:hypothetical protein